MRKLVRPKHNVIVVAHPDDETIFFGGLIQKLKRCHVVLVTDANADGQGQLRLTQFERALELLKVDSFEVWGFPDIYENRLDTSEVCDRLRTLGKPKRVFTHNIFGEYGHPHHQDVSASVHRCWRTRVPVLSTAYNLAPDMVVQLTKAQLKLKQKILSEIYFSETKRFQWMLPASFSEGFVKVSPSDVEQIYAALSTGSQLRIPARSPLRWFAPYLDEYIKQLPPRRF